MADASSNGFAELTKGNTAIVPPTYFAEKDRENGWIQGGEKLDIFGEYGRIGQRRYAGVFFEEFLTELQGQKGIEAYKEMSENDDIIGAMLFAIEMLMRQVVWDI